MLHDGATGTARIDAAASLLCRLQRASPQVPLECLAAEAVDALFCTRIVFGLDMVECRLARRRAALTAEVTRRAALADPAGITGQDANRVDAAVEQPVPAGDPLAWVQGA